MYALRLRWIAIFLFASLVLAFGGGWWVSYKKHGAGAENIAVLGHWPVARGLDMPVFYVQTTEKKVAFTFDISWGRQTAVPVLDILKENNIKATFFLTGFWAKKQPDIAQRIVADGHEIASHGDAHVNLSQYDGEAIAKNLMTAHRDLEEVTGVQARLFRPPNGDYDDLVVATARQLGYETIIWSLDTIDWKNPGPDYMINRVNSNVAPGDIILMHASDSSKQIHLALPKIISDLRGADYEITTLGALMSEGAVSRDDPRGRPRRQ